MKKFLFLIAVCCLITTATKAQDVLNEIVKTSLSITNDTTLSREVRKAAVFKYDAMSYLRSKVLPPQCSVGTEDQRRLTQRMYQDAQ